MGVATRRGGEPDAWAPAGTSPRRQPGPPEPARPIEIAAQPEPGPVVRMVTAKPVTYAEEPQPEPRVVLPSPYVPKKVEPKPEPRRRPVWVAASFFFAGIMWFGVVITRDLTRNARRRPYA